MSGNAHLPPPPRYVVLVGLLLSTLNRLPLKVPQKGPGRKHRGGGESGGGGFEGGSTVSTTFADVAGVDEAKEELQVRGRLHTRRFGIMLTVQWCLNAGPALPCPVTAKQSRAELQGRGARLQSSAVQCCRCACACELGPHAQVHRLTLAPPACMARERFAPGLGTALGACGGGSGGGWVGGCGRRGRGLWI